MNPLKNHLPDEDLASLSIPDAEEIIEEALEELAYSTDPGLVRALQFLAPRGYQAIVELCSENGRSKRRNGDASTWSPEEDEIRIYFERTGGDDDDEEAPIRPRVQAVTRSRPLPRQQSLPEPGNSEHPGPDTLPADIDDRIRELTATLAEAERGGHAFIALKWFRDSFLPRKSFSWNQQPESRQLILAEAIQRGVVLTSKIPNPKTPAYPTTTIRLNRAEAGIPEEAQRFRPISVHGEALADTLEDERGNQ
jgi:hypothetical protein